jgi:hypothetical protein
MHVVINKLLFVRVLMARIDLFALTAPPIQPVLCCPVLIELRLGHFLFALAAPF